jgi:archaellum component FlaC
MQVMARETWTDERLDDLNAKVDRGFEQVDKRFEQVDKRFEQVDKRFEQVDRRFEQIDKRFERVEDEFKAVRRETKEGFDAMNLRFESLNRVLITGVIAICGSMATGFAAVATQL